MKEQEPKPSWLSCIIFGIFNILLVLLCTKLGVMLLSVSMMLLLACGVVATAQCMIEDWQNGFKASAFGCAAGLLLQILAVVLYVFGIFSGLIGIFNR